MVANNIWGYMRDEKRVPFPSECRNACTHKKFTSQEKGLLRHSNSSNTQIIKKQDLIKHNSLGIDISPSSESSPWILVAGPAMDAKSRSSSTLTNARSTSWPIPKSVGWSWISTDGFYDIPMTPIWSLESLDASLKKSMRHLQNKMHTTRARNFFGKSCFFTSTTMASFWNKNVSESSKNKWVEYMFHQNFQMFAQLLPPTFTSFSKSWCQKFPKILLKGLQWYQLHSDPRSDLLAANRNNDWWSKPHVWKIQGPLVTRSWFGVNPKPWILRPSLCWNMLEQ